tara:strand:- start:914 stop:1081 length:168 start_codon:yes stop_codon:yes gene_type:complete
MPSTPRKPIEQIGTEIEQINRMLIAIKKDIQEIKEYIKPKPEPDPTEPIGGGWFF